VVAEFDRFDDKDLLLLHTIVEVYSTLAGETRKHALKELCISKENSHV
jgi:hypothetical protein